MSLTLREKQTAIQYALNGATFMFLPSVKLCNVVAQNNLRAKGMNKVLKYALLQRKPLRLDSEMILKYCNGTLDIDNSWVLDQGDIKVVPPQFETKTKEDEDDTGK
jgi:hypothetical protein